MNLKLFYSTPKWWAFVPPEKPNITNYKTFTERYRRRERYKREYAEAKANALEVGNETLLEMFFGIGFPAVVIEPDKVYDWPGSAVIKDGKYILSI